MSRSFIARSKKNLKTFCFAKNHVPRAVSVPFFPNQPSRSTSNFALLSRYKVPKVGINRFDEVAQSVPEPIRHFLSRSFVSVCFLVFNERRRLIVGWSWNLKWRPRPLDGTSGANRSTIGLNRFRSSFKSLPLSEFGRKAFRNLGYFPLIRSFEVKILLGEGVR